MKQAVLRKTLQGDWTPFVFEDTSRFFYVKNFSNSDAFVSFESGVDEDKSFLIPSGSAEEVAITWVNNDRDKYWTNTIYVKGTGVVEVQALEAVVD